MVKKTAKVSQDSAPDGILPEDDIIEGEVSARDDEVPVANSPLAAKANVTGAIFAILFSLVALGLASFLVYERQNAADSLDEKLGLLAGQMAELEAQTTAQAEQTAKLGAALQEALLAKPEESPSANPRQAAGLMALMMWQDMRAGHPLDAYQPFVMTLSDEEAKARLNTVIADWQRLDYQELVAQGRSFLGRDFFGRGQAFDGDEGDGVNTEEEGLLSGMSKWVAGLVKLEPLAGQEEVPAQDMPAQDIIDQPMPTTALRLDEILAATKGQEGAEITAWRQAVQEATAQEERLSVLVIAYLTDEAILP